MANHIVIHTLKFYEAFCSRGGSRGWHLGICSNKMYVSATKAGSPGLFQIKFQWTVRVTSWYIKKQATVETATYGSEYVAARTCVEQIVDLCNTL